MANMSIGGITLRHNPTEWDTFEPEKCNADAQTLESGVYYSWGMFLVGTTREFKFSYMEADEYKDLKDLYEADEPVVCVPNDGLGKSYNVEMKYFYGPLFRKFGFSAGTFRKDVVMKLFILSEVT
ncbi:MAG: hypothetical protein ABIJ37_03075 [Pseudomonadota bacterium]